MTIRVELFGPSGVGKSTLLEAAAARRDDLPWSGPDALKSASDGVNRTELERDAIDAAELRPFVDACLQIVQESSLSPSRRIAALTILRRAAGDHRLALTSDLPGVLVHDELLLHRAFSLLPQAEDVERDAAEFFRLAPLPDAAVLVRADADTLLKRIHDRGTVPNCYADLDEPGLRAAVERTVVACDVATTVLRDRGLDLLVLDASGDVDTSTDQLLDLIARYTGRTTMTDRPIEDDDDIRERLVAASGSFRKKAGRHELRTREVMYCAFSTPAFTVTKEEAQRDAARRLERFGLDRSAAEGRRALDLGANAGAMLFELNNLGLAEGLGIEYDQDKVDLATEIASLSSLDHLTFRQDDIDALDAADVGTFDIVLALAIEAHVQDPPRLYELLGKVTSGTLYFEGNNKCDLDDATRRLEAAGFASIERLGFCDDDRDPRNNTRPMLVARKKAAKRSWFGRS